MSKDEADIEHAPIAPQVAHAIPGLPPGAIFATQTVYSTPSALVRALVRGLPPSEQLTRDQTLFMVKVAVCDVAYEDMAKPRSERRPPTHLLLPGQGGSGKTHASRSFFVHRGRIQLAASLSRRADACGCRWL